MFLNNLKRAEPEGAHSGECLWRNAFKCFTGGLNCCYLVLTYICGLPICSYLYYIFLLIKLTKS